jgi:acyl-CoA thioesterase-1
MRKLILFLLVIFLGRPVWATEPVILVVGDSLSAGYGIELEQGWVVLLQKHLKESGYRYRVVNASISGDTTSGALRRLPAALKKYTPAIVILELGGNDGLRGLSLQRSHDNLDQLVRLSKQAGAKVLLLGMQIPPNYGPQYTQGFASIYRSIAEKYSLAFVPFFLEGVEGREWMQADGIHPKAEAQAVLLKNVWPKLRGLLK